MSDLLQACQRLLTSIRDGRPGEELDAAGAALQSRAEGAGADELDRAVQLIAEGLPDIEDPKHAGLAAVHAGALVEEGGSPAPLGPPVLRALPGILELAHAFEQRCLERLPELEEEPDDDLDEDDDDEDYEDEDYEDEDYEDDDYEDDDLEDDDPPTPGLWIDGRFVPMELAREVATEHRRSARGFDGRDFISRAAIACLTRDAGLRGQARQDEVLLDAIARFEPDSWLRPLLLVLDDEPLLVLCPETGLGVRLVIGGISDNFQLNTLLADRLVREGTEGPEWGLPGRRPPAEEVAVADGSGPQSTDGTVDGQWSLYGWRALQPDGELPDEIPVDHWIWNEGSPASIEPFEGLRVVLIGPAPYQRSWNLCRSFDALVATAEVVEVLTREETDRWLRRLGATERPSDPSP